MFTVCPKCTLTLAVTANDLRVGQGYVRCGRCSNVFNALLKLSEAPAEGAGTDLPELAQAAAASTSQINRAITAAAVDGGAAAGSAAASQAAPSRPAPRPATPAAPPRSPAPAPGAPGSSAPSPAPSPATTLTKPAATAARATPTTTAAPTAPARVGAAGAQPPAARESAPTPPPAVKASPSDAVAGMMRRRSTDAAAEPQTSPGGVPPTPSKGAPRQAATSPTPAVAASPPSAARPPSSAGSAALAAANAPPAAALPAAPPKEVRTPTRPAAAVQAPAGLSAHGAAPNGGPAKESDNDALDQFELVLQTLGLNANGEEPARGLEADSGPTQTVENIVLEGDEVRQSEARVPDKPLDELDLFTRRLGIAAGDKAGASPKETGATPGRQGQAPTSPGAARPIAGRLAARRTRLAGRRSTDTAAGPTAGGDGALAAARAAGRDPGITEPETFEIDGTENVAAAAGSPDLDIPALRAAPPMQQRLWLGGSAALVVLLLAQFINHWRDALAASPTWGHPVTGLYAALGVPLQPHWDLSAYEVRQQGAESAGGPHAAIRVRFSLANHATRAQPVPLLRLTLLDRYGRRVAERDLTPLDYWPKGRSAQSFLSADERVDTEVQVRDPSADSASFELDVCLPEGRGGIRCAGDAAAAQAAGVPP